MKIVPMEKCWRQSVDLLSMSFLRNKLELRLTEVYAGIGLSDWPLTFS